MKKKKIIITVITIIIIILVIGVSYAWLTTTILGKKEYVLKAGDLDLILDETSNGLTIDEAIPVEDEIGLASEGASFSVINHGSSNICYEIYLDDIELTEDEKRVEDKYIKYSLDKDSDIGKANVLTSAGPNPNRLIDSNEIRAGDRINYKLHLWFNIKEDAELGGQVFKGRLRIEAVQCNNTIPIMKSYSVNSTEDYHAEEYRTKITTIVTKTDTLVPSSAIKYWDVSENNNGSVIAYIDGDAVSGYQLTIGGDKIIFTNPSSGFLFDNFTQAKTIDLSYFNTSQTTVMRYMFENCANLTALNISNFNTTNVVDMEGMFSLCTSLNKLDLSAFDTTKVKFFNWFLSGCSNLQILSLGNFSSDSATNMRSMFANCPKLVTIDLTSFDTSNAVDMTAMFNNDSNLVRIYVGKNWNITSIDLATILGNCGTNELTVILE